MKNIRAIFSLGASLFCIIFLWDFWTRGPGALGLNAFVYSGAMLFFLVWMLKKEARFEVDDLAWVLPLSFLSVSFLLYENPFFKVFNIIVLPLLVVVFYNYAWMNQKESAVWNITFFSKLFDRVMNVFFSIGESMKEYSGILLSGESEKRKIILRVLTGLIVLVVALIVVLPLLSSADSAFSDKLGVFYDFLQELFSTSVIAKISVFIISSVLILSMFISFVRPMDNVGQQEESMRDGVIWGITMSGVLIFYAIFLWVQLDRLWVGALPFEFKDTESLVKSGFWQLLVLSFINLLVFFFLYRRTNGVVQKILGLFTFASLLLLVSSGHRMLLYVKYYGFSYEKFYALYVVIFCGILFLWLISRMFMERKSNVLKFVFFLFLWMFSLVSLFPTEQFILKTNVSLVKNEGSQIRLFEMTMLSADVLARVKDYERNGILAESEDYLIRESRGERLENFDWKPWISEREEDIEEKSWYEYTISALLQ